MNKILFRAKQAGGSGKWVYGFYVEAETLDKSGIEYFIIEKSADGESHLIIPETVGQYTGLTDKNGIKIFEGDVVEVTDDYGSTTLCDCGVGCICFLDGTWYVQDEVNNGLYEINRSYYIEVIGNIHDNPDLLKGGADNDRKIFC